MKDALYLTAASLYGGAITSAAWYYVFRHIS